MPEQEHLMEAQRMQKLNFAVYVQLKKEDGMGKDQSEPL